MLKPKFLCGVAGLLGTSCVAWVMCVFLSQHTICPFFWGEMRERSGAKRSPREGGVHIVLFYSVEYLSKYANRHTGVSKRNIFTTEQICQIELIKGQ